MTAAKGKPAKEKKQKKSIGGRMPVKRSINLVLVDENKINPFKAILGVLVIAVLAAVFGKYLVYDRLVDMSRATYEVNQMRDTLDDLTDAIDSYGEVEDDYAHYTYDNMTPEELGLVDRIRVGELVKAIMDEQDSLFDMKAYNSQLLPMLTALGESGNPVTGLKAFRENVTVLGNKILAQREQVYSWSVTGNILTVELTGKSLKRLNQLARVAEACDITDSCSLSTANKDAASLIATASVDGVRAKFVIYLVKPVEGAGKEADAA